MIKSNQGDNISSMKGPPSIEDNNNAAMSSQTNWDVDFSEYMWMAEELEEFDKKVEEELWEEAFIEACFEQMLAEEETDQSQWYVPSPRQLADSQLVNGMRGLQVSSEPPQQPAYPAGSNAITQEEIQKSSLNPNAPIFVPRAVKS